MSSQTDNHVSWLVRFIPDFTKEIHLVSENNGLSNLHDFLENSHGSPPLKEIGEYAIKQELPPDTTK